MESQVAMLGGRVVIWGDFNRSVETNSERRGGGGKHF